MIGIPVPSFELVYVSELVVIAFIVGVYLALIPLTYWLCRQYLEDADRHLTLLIALLWPIFLWPTIDGVGNELKRLEDVIKDKDYYYVELRKVEKKYKKLLKKRK